MDFKTRTDRTWQERLAAAGRYLDRHAGQARDLMLVQTEGGVIVQYLQLTSASERDAWVLKTVELSDEQLANQPR